MIARPSSDQRLPFWRTYREDKDIVCGCLLGALASLSAGAPARAQGLPDLVVRTDILERNWVVRDEKLSPEFCSVIEGEVTPGLRRLVRFTVMTANVGTADINIGDPRVHYDANDGLFELAICHQHFHFRNYAVYELIDPRTGQRRSQEGSPRALKSPDCPRDLTPLTHTR